jgi:AcrR family transcriptional regulator
MHSTDEFLAAAGRLFADGGARALTMTAVAKDVGAPNGSMYHRFRDRSALLAALWLRTSQGFQRGYLDVLGEPPTPAGAVSAAVWTVEWCRTHLPEAIVLLAGVRAFEPDAWPDTARAELAAGDDALRRAMKAIVRQLAVQTEVPSDQIAFVMLDLPLAVVRRHLQAGEPPPKQATELVRGLAGRVLSAQSGPVAGKRAADR